LVSLVKASWGLGSKTLADIFLPGANTEELQSLAKYQRESSTPEIAAKILELFYSIDVTRLLPNIKIPTLILHREGDKVITIDHGRELQNLGDGFMLSFDSASAAIKCACDIQKEISRSLGLI